MSPADAERPRLAALKRAAKAARLEAMGVAHYAGTTRGSKAGAP